MIQIKGLDKYFNRHKNNEIHVIDNTSLEFEDNGLVCILGESGSGKTTLLNTIGGLDTFSGGTITVDDITLKGYSASKIELLRNKKFGYIFQNYYLLEDETVEYNIRIALEIFDITEEELQARTEYVLDAVDMLKYRKKMMSELSGGQKQRVAIARALAKAPDIIFADEPTGNLDENNTVKVMSIVKKISEKCLVILVTHERRIADFFADRIIEVKDGKVISDKTNKGGKAYSRVDDTNIYLGEYSPKAQYEDGLFNVYSDGSDFPVKLNLVFKDGRLYIQSSDDGKTVFITGNSETQMLEGKKPTIEEKDIEEFDYNLEAVRLKKRPHLKFKETVAMALNNVRALGKKQAFMFVAMIITAVLIVLAVADYYSMSQIDIKDFVTEDSHYVNITTEWVGGVNFWDDSDDSEIITIDDCIKEFLDSGIDGRLMPSTSVMMYMRSNKYAQYSDVTFTYSQFGYVDYDMLDEDDLIYGRLPESKQEIVLDKMLYEKIIEERPQLQPVLESYEDLEYITVTIGFNSGPIRICGIADNGEMTAYVNKALMVNVGNQTYKIGFLSDLQKAYPGEYDDINLDDKSALISRDYYENYRQHITDHLSNMYDISVYEPQEGFDDDFGVDIVLSEEGYEHYLYVIGQWEGKFKIYTNEPDKVVEFFSERADAIRESQGLKVEVTHTYDKQLKSYLESKQLDVNARYIVTGGILLLSLIIMFFMMKTNATNRMGELVVYRLIGISPRSITVTYILEIFMMVSRTQLPATVFVCCILKYLSGIKNLGFATSCPLYLMFLIIVVCYVINIIVGLIPIWKIVKLPPAKLAAKN